MRFGRGCSGSSSSYSSSDTTPADRSSVATRSSNARIPTRRRSGTDMSDGTRLNKYIAQAGVTSRRGADELISRGKVRVNGRVTRELGTVVRDGDRVDVSGTPVRPVTEPVYLVLNKPVSVVTTLRD